MRFLFGDYVRDAARHELWHGAELIEVEPQVFDLLLHLVRNRDRIVSRDDLLAEVWQELIVSESTINSRINAARRAIGDSGELQLLIRTIPRRGLRFVGEVREQVTNPSSREPSSAAMKELRAPGSATPSQEVIFCRTTDHVHIAVAIAGSGLPVVKTANWLIPVEFDWHSPVWSPLLARLASEFGLVCYDGRGNGLSDWNVADISFEAFVRDLEAVVDTLRLRQFALLGISQGAAVSIAYAARHPERVSRLVLCGGFALGWRKRGSAAEIARREALLTFVQHGWGQDNPAFRQVFATLYIPDATPEQMQCFNDLARVSSSPDNPVRLISIFGDIAVTDLLSQVTAPTLVLHSRGDPIPFEQGLMLAREIPSARFVALDSRSHRILSHKPAWARFVDEVLTFLRAEGSDLRGLAGEMSARRRAPLGAATMLTDDPPKTVLTQGSRGSLA